MTEVDEGPVDGRHTCWSDPGGLRDRLGEIADRPAGIADQMELFVIHHQIARNVGFGVPARAEGDRGLRLLSRLLAVVVARDGRALTAYRAIGDYLYVTCRGFAMLAMSALRAWGVAAGGVCRLFRGRALAGSPGVRALGWLPAGQDRLEVMLRWLTR